MLAAVAGGRADGRPATVLLDPCNGIADTRHRRGRVRHLRIDPASVSRLWAGLTPGDNLVVWQWPLPDRMARLTTPSGCLRPPLSRPA